MNKRGIIIFTLLVISIVQQGFSQKYDLSDSEIRKNYICYNLNSISKNPDTTIGINIRNQGYKELSCEIGLCKNLIFINAMKNSIQTICSDIGNCHKLRTCILRQNKIDSLPPSFFTLRALGELDLSRNNLQHVNYLWQGLQQLEQLTLSQNKIEQLDDAFFKMKKIKYLDLSKNKINEVPSSILSAGGLIKLNLTNNEINFLSENIFKLKNLEELNLDHNRIEQLPKISKRNKIKILIVSHNQLKVLPKDINKLNHLETLVVSFNNLMELPEELFKIKSLQTIVINDNLFSAEKIKGYQEKNPRLRFYN